MKEIFFLIKESPEGGFEAEALGQAIFTEADTVEELKSQRRMVTEPSGCRPEKIRQAFKASD